MKHCVHIAKDIILIHYIFNFKDETLQQVYMGKNQQVRHDLPYRMTFRHSGLLLSNIPHTTFGEMFINHDTATHSFILPTHVDLYYMLKALMPITFSSPRAQPEVVYFLVSNKSPYFSHCKSEISPSNSL